MREKKTACLDREMKQLSTDQLDELLQKELRKDMPDENIVLPILKELRRRETDCPVSIVDKAPISWDEYQKRAVNTNDAPRGKRCSRLLKVVAVAAVVALVVLVIPFATDASSAMDALFWIRNSVVEFFRPGNENVDSTGRYIFQTDNPGLQQVYDAVVELGVTDPVVPMWFPEGYELVELEEVSIPGGIRIFARFKNEEKTIVFQIKSAKEASLSQYEKNEDTRYYEVNSKRHIICNNIDEYGAVWVSGNIESMISTETSEETLLEIIDSIYWRK